MNPRQTGAPNQVGVERAGADLRRGYAHLAKGLSSCGRMCCDTNGNDQKSLPQEPSGHGAPLSFRSTVHLSRDLPTNRACDIVSARETSAALQSFPWAFLPAPSARCPSARQRLHSTRSEERLV